MKRGSLRALAYAAVVVSGSLWATGPLVVQQGEKVDAAAVAKILNPGFVTRSIREPDTPASVALRIPFAFGSAKVPDAALPQLEAMSQAIKQAGTKVLIEGHTDSVGNDEYNRRLSQQRAAAVRDVLVSTYGVDRKELKVVGMGKERPLPNVDPANGENRRVEFRADR